MYKWDNIQTKTEMEFVLKCIEEKMKSKKIKRIFDLEGGFGEDLKDNMISVSIDDEIYIQFEDDFCLIINLTQESNAFVEYRKLTENEKSLFLKLADSDKDFFNSHREIHSWITKEDGSREPSSKPYRIIDINLDYDELEKFEVIGFNTSFEKWISNGNGSSEITLPEGGDYFNQINFIMRNGTKICLAAEDAVFDGYADIWIEDKSGNLKVEEKLLK